MKHILITGKNGYIASSLLQYLQGFPEEYTVEAVSLRGGAWRATNFTQYDAVVHCVGYAHVRESVENAHLFYEVNRDLTLAVAEQAKAGGVGQFVFLSSLSVYGMDEGVITPETMPQPNSAYGRSKLEAELGLLVQETARFRVAILRPPMVYGPGCKGNYHALEKLAKFLPVMPGYENRRSAVSIDRLCGQIKKVLDERARGVYVPQDEEYLCTCAEIKRLAKERGRHAVSTKLLNFGPALLRKCTGKGRKAFGDLVYKE